MAESVVEPVRGRFIAPTVMRDTQPAGIDGDGTLAVVGDVLVIDARKLRQGLRQTLAALGFLAGFALCMDFVIDDDLGLEPDLWVVIIAGTAFAGMWTGGWLGKRFGGSQRARLHVPRGGAVNFHLDNRGNLRFTLAHDGLHGIVIFSPARGEVARYDALCDALGLPRRGGQFA